MRNFKSVPLYQPSKIPSLSQTRDLKKAPVVGQGLFKKQDSFGTKTITESLRKNLFSEKDEQPNG